MKKFLITIISIILSLSCFLAVGCGKPEEHTCSFSSEWSYDETNHWRDCTGDTCVNLTDFGAHQMDGRLCSVCSYEIFDGIDKWDGSLGTLAPVQNGFLVLSTANEFAAFAHSVNEGESYYGVTVILLDDVNLDGRDWMPIGSANNRFEGNFDGNGRTIYNLQVGYEGENNQGLFGATALGEIKNFTVRHANITGRLNIGVIAGNPGTATFSDITVSGKVKVNGFSYVGGVFGKDLQANVSNITVDVLAGSYVKANSIEVDERGDVTNYRTYVGGVIGFIMNGDYTLTNVKSNIDVYGTICDVGGITGMAHYGNSFINCSSSGNIYITEYVEDGEHLEIGGIAGVWRNDPKHPVTFRNCTFSGTLTAINHKGVKYQGEFENGGLVGKRYADGGGGQLIIE